VQEGSPPTYARSRDTLPTLAIGIDHSLHAPAGTDRLADRPAQASAITRALRGPQAVGTRRERARGAP
jgi:hypothetical protein